MRTRNVCGDVIAIDDCIPLHIDFEQMNCVHVSHKFLPLETIFLGGFK